MKLWDKIRRKSSKEVSRIELVTERGSGYYSWNGKIYHSDIVRACIRPKVKAIGKLIGKQIREIQKGNETDLVVNPDASIRFLLEEPNPYMSQQKFLEKLAVQLVLNNNAFALIIRDEAGIPCELFPISATSYEAIYQKNGALCIRFTMYNGKMFTFAYEDLIHLRQDYNENDIFGTPIAEALAPLMEIVTTTDQGVVNAIKNSAIIKWLIQYTNSLRPEDIKENAKSFAETYLSVSGENLGVAAVDSKADIKQIEQKEYIPNSAQMDRTMQRIQSLFGTNEKIVQSKYDENEWLAYFESEIEPVAIDLHYEFTRKIFTRRERALGNKIVFEASDLKFASLQTILNFREMVDRGAMTPNEWRRYLNLAPVPGGNVPIRRLDTAQVTSE